MVERSIVRSTFGPSSEGCLLGRNTLSEDVVAALGCSGASAGAFAGSAAEGEATFATGAGSGCGLGAGSATTGCGFGSGLTSFVSTAGAAGLFADRSSRLTLSTILICGFSGSTVLISSLEAGLSATFAAAGSTVSAGLGNSFPNSFLITLYSSSEILMFRSASTLYPFLANKSTTVCRPILNSFNTLFNLTLIKNYAYIFVVLF